MKECSKCKKVKSLSEFWKRAASPDGLHVWCKTCAAASHKKWAQKNLEKSAESRRKWRVKNPGKDAASKKKYYESNRGLILERSRKARYGISPEDFDQRVSAQGGVCAICKQPPKGKFSVDHDHNSGIVRGLLCLNCNLALGHLNDSPALAAAASVYLNAHIISQYCVGIKKPKTERID